MIKEVLLTITTNFSWSSLLESAIGSLAGAFFGGIIALVIAKSQIKKGEEQFEQQTRHSNEMRIKSDKVNLEIVRLTKDYEHNLQKLIENRKRIFLLIETLEDYQEKIYQYLKSISLEVKSDSLRHQDVSFSAQLFSAFATTLQYTYTFAYKHSDTLDNQQMVDMVQRIEELLDLVGKLDEHDEKSGQEKRVRIVEISFEVMNKAREILVIYIDSLEKLDNRVEELHEQFKKDAKAENLKLDELYSDT